MIDFQKLGKMAAKSEPAPQKIVAGRVVQYDADFACYEVANLEETTAQSFKRLLRHIDFKRRMAGAEHANAHITLGLKSGRDTMATVKPYQENRDPDAPIKVRVRELRHLLANHKPPTVPTLGHPQPVYSLFHEADDMMVRYQHARIKTHGVGSSVIMSGDKDLWMGQGWHCDPKTGQMHLVNGYGHTEYREVGNIKPKLVGEGRSWFWHQMIMGDGADNIPGLEKISNSMLDKYTPLKSRKPRKKGAGLCGEGKAVIVLDGVTTDSEAARRVWQLYSRYYGDTAKERFVEQAYLLWMQRDDNPWDVLDYLHNDCGVKVLPSNKQRQIVKEFIELCAS